MMRVGQVFEGWHGGLLPIEMMSESARVEHVAHDYVVLRVLGGVLRGEPLFVSGDDVEALGT